MPEVYSLQKQRKRNSAMTQQGMVILLILILAIMVVGVTIMVIAFAAPPTRSLATELETETYILPTLAPTEPPTEPDTSISYPTFGADVQYPEDALGSEHAILIDTETNSVLALKGEADEHIFPASMTKLMTLIVAIEHIDDLDDTFTMTEEILEPLWEASKAGFQAGEVCKIRDLLYGAALASGADATSALAIYTAGSEETFVEWMNQKCTEIGLQNTHFVTTSGLHDEDHYSTITEIAMILEYCLQNDLCRSIISTYSYTTEPTEQHPEGITMYNTMYNYMYGTEVEGISILGGKTGFTDQAGQCLASYAETPDGHRYICVTSFGTSKWHPVFDCFKLYGIVTGTYPMETEAAEEAPAA